MNRRRFVLARRVAGFLAVMALASAEPASQTPLWVIALVYGVLIALVWSAARTFRDEE